jgi:DNA-binding Lrp family transcriptional regulator
MVEGYIFKEMKVIKSLFQENAMAKDTRDQDSINETKILNELRKNAKMNIETIAKNCGMTRQKVYRIIKHLEETRTIWGYTVIVDDENQRSQKYILLLKRSNQPITKGTADTIAWNRFENIYADLGIAIESSYYLHGEYDWIIIFTAEDLRHAKKFGDLLVQNYPGIIAKMNLMQILFSNKEHYVYNPDPDTLNKFL